jgi:Ca2+:H+ antiporter
MTAIEVMSITAVMTHGDSNPTLVRDTLFSVVMLVMGGMVGISLLLGAFRHREQAINLQGANAYLGVIVPLLVLCLVLPSFTRTTEMPTLSTIQQIMLGIMAMGLYATFLMMQMGRHRAYFMQPGDEPTPALADRTGLLPHFVLLLVNMLPVVLLVQQLARPVDHIIETLGAPHIIGGLIMAVMIATPEGLGGIKAALRNQLQTSVNVFLGSVLAAVGLSIPIMLLVSNLLGLELVLGLDATEMVLLLLMFAVSVITFSSGRTNLLQGAVHLLLFVAFLVLQIES